MCFSSKNGSSTAHHTMCCSVLTVATKNTTANSTWLCKWSVFCYFSPLALQPYDQFSNSLCDSVNNSFILKKIFLPKSARFFVVGY